MHRRCCRACTASPPVAAHALQVLEHTSTHNGGAIKDAGEIERALTSQWQWANSSPVGQTGPNGVFLEDRHLMVRALLTLLVARAKRGDDQTCEMASETELVVPVHPTMLGRGDVHVPWQEGGGHPKPPKGTLRQAVRSKQPRISPGGASAASSATATRRENDTRHPPNPDPTEWAAQLFRDARERMAETPAIVTVVLSAIDIDDGEHDPDAAGGGMRKLRAELTRMFRAAGVRTRLRSEPVMDAEVCYLVFAPNLLETVQAVPGDGYIDLALIRRLRGLVGATGHAQRQRRGRVEPSPWPFACRDGTPSAQYPFCDTSRSTDARVADLVSRIRREDKAMLLTARAMLPLPYLGVPAYYW